MRLTSEPVHPASVFLSETNREEWRKGRVFISPRFCCSPPVFVQQPCRRSSVRFQNVLPTSCCVPFLEIKACVLDSVCVIQDHLPQLYEWAAKEFGGLTKDWDTCKSENLICHLRLGLAPSSVHLWLLELLVQPWWRSPRIPQGRISHTCPRDLPRCPPWPVPFRRPRCKHSPAHTDRLSAWAKALPNGLRLRACRWIPVTSRDGAWPQKPFKWCLSL